jgi:hypothetical protein
MREKKKKKEKKEKKISQSEIKIFFPAWAIHCKLVRPIYKRRSITLAAGISSTSG